MEEIDGTVVTGSCVKVLATVCPNVKISLNGVQLRSRGSAGRGAGAPFKRSNEGSAA